MMKFILLILFLNFMVKKNKMMSFYFNLIYLTSFMMIFMIIYKDMNIWVNITMDMGCSCYSIMLIMLSVWIIGLMCMCLSEKGEDWSIKLFVIFNMLTLLMMFFMFMDVIKFYLMYEMSLIPTFFLIIYWGSNPERLSSSFYMIMYMLLISFPLLIYIFDMYMYSFTMKFSLMIKVMENYKFSFWSFLLIYLTFFIKLPIYIFHIWLPKAHTEAPVYGSMILAGVLLKMGGYGVMRLMEMTYKILNNYNYLVFSISIVGSMGVSILCLTQIDMKSMVAYSSVVHMNLLLCSLLTMFKMGVVGGYLVMISHGLCSSGLFYMVNMFYKRSMSRLLFLNKGMISVMPTTVMWWFLFCIINFSFPLTLNFIGEMIVLMVILNWNLSSLFYLMLICLFSCAYSLYLYSYISHGKNNYYEYKVINGLLKEYVVLVNHIYPLVFFMLNLSMFV